MNYKPNQQNTVKLAAPVSILLATYTALEVCHRPQNQLSFVDAHTATQNHEIQEGNKTQLWNGKPEAFTQA
jgi:hypothetical protein